MKILINGMGCIPGTGARLLLEEFIKNGNNEHDVVCHLPFNGENDKQMLHIPQNIRIRFFKHKLWGRYFRILYELYVNVLLLINKYDVCFNFSNYGLAVVGKHFLYFHNQTLLEQGIKAGFAQGQPNVAKRWMFNNLLKKAICVVVQADHVNISLKEYCLHFKIPYPKKILVVKPCPFLGQHSNNVQKIFPFQFFYPSSNTLVKRDDLAIQSLQRVNKRDSSIGLVITCGNGTIDRNGVKVLNWLNRNEVSSQMSVCDALLFTSEAETLGLPLLESLYFEKPAVLPDLPYAREIYGEAAVYFENGRIEDVEKAVSILIKCYEAYKVKAKERKVIEFSNRVSWDKHWEIFFKNI